MNKIKLLLIITIISSSLVAQEKQELKNILGISPLQIVNGVRIKYERLLNKEITYGGILTGYYPNPKHHDYTGIQLAPIARLYFTQNAPKGFYCQAKVLGGVHSTEIMFVETYQINPEDVLFKSENKKHIFASFGAGMVLGFQAIWGDNKRMVLDMNLGLKYMGDIPMPATKESQKVYHCNDSRDWFLIGPASVIDGLISIGYRF